MSIQNLPGSIKSACGGKIIIGARAREHMLIHADVGAVLTEAISKLRLPRNGAFLETDVDLGCIVGKTTCLQTDPIDPTTVAYFAKRNGRQAPSRVLPGETPAADTSHVAIVARSLGEPGVYTLVTAWLGEKAKKEPWDKALTTDAERVECLNFWCRHALIHEPATMEPIFESSWSAVMVLP